MEILCVQETKWRGDRVRKVAEGYKMLHSGGDGMSNGVGKLDEDGGIKIIFKMARNRTEDGRDAERGAVIKDNNRRLIA